jgi:hypothetical protein
MRAIVEVRTQHARTGRSGYSGPNAYVAVQIVPDGVSPLVALRHNNVRGITIYYVGEGYKKHTGPRSRLGRALQRAQSIANRINRRVHVSTAFRHGSERSACFGMRDDGPMPPYRSRGFSRGIEAKSQSRCGRLGHRGSTKADA